MREQLQGLPAVRADLLKQKFEEMPDKENPGAGASHGKGLGERRLEC